MQPRRLARKRKESTVRPCLGDWMKRIRPNATQSMPHLRFQGYGGTTAQVAARGVERIVRLALQRTVTRRCWWVWRMLRSSTADVLHTTCTAQRAGKGGK